MSEHVHRRLEWLTLAYVLALVLLVVAAGRGWLAVAYLAGLPAVDKAAHFLFMGLLSYLVNVALGGEQWRWRRLAVLRGSALVLAVVAVEELSQLWLTRRSFELADLAADVAGIWVFGELGRRRSRRAGL